MHDGKVLTITGDGGREEVCRVEGGPDGICLDAEGAVWFADPMGSRCVRVAEGGEVLEVIPTDGRTLFLVTATFASIEQVVRERNGVVLAVDVDVPGAGWP